MQKTIFVVDDSKTNLSIAEETLEKTYRVITMTSAIRMFVILEKIIPDLILMDVAMPEMSGFDAMTKLKANNRYANIPVIFLTALADSYNEAYGIELGAVDFVMKPFSEAVLLHRIRHHLSIDDLVKERTEKLERAIAASSAKSDYLSNMSHEMRTPLNAIIGMTAIGEKAGDIAEKNRAFSVIGNASSHLLGVINDVLDMAKIEANKLELAPIEYCFDLMLQKAISIINFRIEEKKQELTVTVDNRIPNFVLGDEQRLVQVLTNLMSNATKFTPDGGNIEIAAFLHEETEEYCCLHITVTDNGIGISPQQQENLFQIFGQAESRISRDYGGSGLGLTISKCIVELMGGGIHIDSELDKGTKITISAKVQRSDNDLSTLLAHTIGLETVKILVINEERETQEQFQHVLSQLKVPFDTAYSSAEALEHISKHGKYDLYFIAEDLSGTDGIELTGILNSGMDTPPHIVLMLSASRWTNIKEHALQAGVTRSLLKPFFASNIVECVNECLERVFGLEDTKESAHDFTGKKLLLAEDQEINREIVIALLDSTCIEIDCAEDGEAALGMIAESPDKYDIVFMDVKMPRMDGLEATRRIRALPVLENYCLPIIAMTANVFTDEIKECLDAGMDDHLGKPIEADRIYEVLHRYLT